MPNLKKSQPHKLHIWFLPTLKAKTLKTKRAIFCQRSTEVRMNDEKILSKLLT